MHKMIIKKFLLLLISIIINVQICHSAFSVHKMFHTKTKNLLLFDFEHSKSLHDWIEVSDTVRSQGKSKATFDLYRTHTQRSAILFTLLNPLPNGACFAGVRTPTKFNLEGYNYIAFSYRATGSASEYKIVLRHNNLDEKIHPTFEQTFKVNTDNTHNALKIPLSQFKAYYRGEEAYGPILNLKHITMFGIQAAGGVYSNFKQSGLSAIELDSIWAMP